MYYCFGGGITKSRFFSIMLWVIRVQLLKHNIESIDIIGIYTPINGNWMEVIYHIHEIDIV